MVRKETCPVCRGNRVVSIDRPTGRSEWRPCNGCNGTGYQVKVVHGGGLPSGFAGRC